MSGVVQKPLLLIERVTGIEPVSPPWQGGIIAVIRYPQFLWCSRGDLPRDEPRASNRMIIKSLLIINFHYSVVLEGRFELPPRKSGQAPQACVSTNSTTRAKIETEIISKNKEWIPAFAGMTDKVRMDFRVRRNNNLPLLFPKIS